jgi:Tfp pilus assembly protein PilO
MKRLSPAKKNQLIMVLVITAAVISAIYFMLIAPQLAANQQLTKDIGSKRDELDKYKKIIAQAVSTSNELESVTSQLDAAQQDTATGDIYSWTYDTIRRFKTNYHVDIPSIDQPTVSDVDILSNFPYKQLRFSLNGTAYYQDLGKFVADFENTFPHMRLLNLTLEPVGDASGGNEHLTFHMEVVALIKPTS